MTNKNIYDIKSKDISSKDRKNDRDKIITKFDTEKTIPIDKNNINDVLSDKTKEFKELEKKDQDVVKKGIELEILYNYNNYKTPIVTKKKHNYLIFIFLIFISLCVLGIYFIVK